MKFLNLFKGKRDTETKESGGFSDFFLHASKEEKKRVLEEAARRANEEQREVLSKLETKTG